MDIFEKVLHALEGEDRIRETWCGADGVRTLERRTFGPDAWIENASHGRLEAINALAVILFAVRDSFDLDAEREIVEGWARELRTAADAGEITPRNPTTLLPLRAPPDGWDWLVSMDDLDALVKARGMGWSCTDVVSHLFSECRKAGESWHEESGKLAARYWLSGYEPEAIKQPSNPAQTDQGTPSDWKAEARTIADEIDATDAKAGAYDSVKGMADRVAQRMSERGISGPRGPVSGATVLRDALQGGRWERKR